MKTPGMLFLDAMKTKLANMNDAEFNEQFNTVCDNNDTSLTANKFLQNAKFSFPNMFNVKNDKPNRRKLISKRHQRLRELSKLRLDRELALHRISFATIVAILFIIFLIAELINSL